METFTANWGITLLVILFSVFFYALFAHSDEIEKRIASNYLENNTSGEDMLGVQVVFDGVGKYATKVNNEQLSSEFSSFEAALAHGVRHKRNAQVAASRRWVKI